MAHRNASIVLLGARGSGKTTLAIIAQASLGLQHVDVDDVFRKETGASVPQFRRQVGTQQSSRKWLAILTRLLSTHSENCVIVWPMDYIEEAGLILLQQFGKDHPVILVQRCTAAIAEYLQLFDATKIEKLMKLIVPRYRSCSNYEYFNLDELKFLNLKGQSTGDLSMPMQETDIQAPRSLRLKRLEESFVRFVKNILHQDPLPDYKYDEVPALQTRAVYTYLLTVPVTQICANDFDVRWLDCGADAIQLEIEFDPEQTPSSLDLAKENISTAFAAATRFFDRPVIYHVNLDSAKLSDSSRAAYIELLNHGNRLGVTFMTVYLGLPVQILESLVKQSRSTKLIGDHHDNTPGLNGWANPARQDMLTQGLGLGFDGIRLTQPALHSADNREAASFVVSANRGKNPKPFVIAYNTEHLGRPSRCFNEILTPVTTEELRLHLSDSIQRHNLRSTITIQQSQNSLYASFIYDPMKYYIIGHDVSYSYSPIIHNAAFEYFGMPHRLHIRSMPTLDKLGDLTRDEDFAGITIAQGFKMTMFSKVSTVSTHARDIGAMNTLLPIRVAFDYTKPPPSDFWAHRNRTGRIVGFYGDNFDWVGIVRSIEQNLSPANVVTSRSSALVIGAGGMARAAIYAFLHMGVQHIVLYNRTVERAHALAEHFSEVSMDTLPRFSTTTASQSGTDTMSQPKRDIRVLDSLENEWYSDLSPPTMVVCCIPAPKIAGGPDNQFLLPPQWMKSSTGGVVVDLNYRILLTPLLRQVRGQAHRGWVAVDGLENLTAQALKQFEVFTCRKVPRNLMRIAALKHYMNSNSQDTEVCHYIEGQLRRLQSKI